MTATEFSQALSALGLSQRAAGPALGSDPRTVRRWASGECPVPRPVALLVGALLTLKACGLT